MRGFAGLTMGLAAAGLTAAAGAAADRLSRDRRTAIALDQSQETGVRRYTATPDEEHVVYATDGVPLHVEVDYPRQEPPEPRPTVVMTHGFCLHLTSWVFQRRALRDAGYRVVLWDLRGHGRSGSAERDSYHVDQLGRDLARVIEEVVPEGPIVLVGHSMGGMTMMSLALEYPDLIRDRVVGAAFIATSSSRIAELQIGLGSLGRFVYGMGPTATGTLAERQGLVDGAVRASRDVVEFLVDRGSFGSPVPLSIAQLTTDMIFSTRMSVISAFIPHFDKHDKREALATYDGIETLVLVGTADRLTPPSHSEELVRLLPGAEYVVVNDAGHVIMLEHPELLSEQILEMIGRAERAAIEHSAPRRNVVRRTVTDIQSQSRAAEVVRSLGQRGWSRGTVGSPGRHQQASDSGHERDT
ncbi:MAG TPA: alpha/beta hydrolase [Dermatophilaceae bacterium]|nr:alpha/beta hydrolase [Dermatophilaceae bacterium]